jgi:hypothetical protein
MNSQIEELVSNCSTSSSRQCQPTRTTSSTWNSQSTLAKSRHWSFWLEWKTTSNI